MAQLGRIFCTATLLLVSGPAFAFPVSSSTVPFYVLLLIFVVLSLSLWFKLHRANQVASQLHNFIHQHQDAVCLLDAELDIQQVNPAFCRITGFRKEQVIGQPLRVFNSQGEPEDIAYTIQKSLLKRQFWHGDIWSRKANQQVFALDLSISCLRPATKSKPALYLATFADISTRKMNELELRRVNTKDPGTRLPNRAVFMDYLERELQSVTEQHPVFAVMILQLNSDADNMPQNLPLVELATAIRSQLPTGVLLARLSTNEFGILLPAYLASQRLDLHCYRLARQVMTALERSTVEPALTPAMGIALYPNDGHSYDQLLRSADHALQRARSAASPIQLFHQASLPRSSDSFLLEQELQSALENQEIRLSFQPKLCVSSNRVTGLEALVRWQHPQRGLLLPAQFLSIAAESDSIIHLDHMVLQQACEHVKHWNNTGLMRGRLALNIASRTFFQPDFLPYYLQQLQQHNLQPEQFELELDQTILEQQPEQSKRILHSAKEAGFFLVLDRFGSGLSALQHLRDYSFDQIKIDGSLIQKLEQSELDRNLTASLIRIAGYLQLGVVACQVENEMQAYLLHVMGCETIQGHVFSKAVLPSELATVIARESRAIRQQTG
ncbi:PAS domain S-box-containing protein/diguanylate cyclase (GGDEF) domain-containing protein [Alkalimonas amylolytica]|uniref:PAS domain S-box-containing protein/diguanylate cyclase (GGDEF) domain-containing protein n=1 Tax=Alkalimonas amylolytica TaxID=152573 RepID=A0A1H3Y3L5_ALKAM|nr:PAS domain S-box-containing protein/diguanylate cyclase (GGDEF) domain-containing protein [Alkalimonas amylolytica]